MDVRTYNRDAWNHAVSTGNKWTIPVTADVIARARTGAFELLLTPSRPVPASWYPPIKGAQVLCLASGGGQQVPVLAAAGAVVTVLDNSPSQLAQDRLVAEREGLSITTVEGDMRDLSTFRENTFDLIFHPCSNCFVPDILPVWRECARVLTHGGTLLAGVCNPLFFVLDPELEKQDVLQIRYGVPYSDVTSLTDEERRRYTDVNEPLCFGHTLEDQLGGQMDAGLIMTGLFEDRDPSTPLGKLMSAFVATRSIKP
mgnify:CR=1 FL=1